MAKEVIEALQSLVEIGAFFFFFFSFVFSEQGCYLYQAVICGSSVREM